MRLIKALLLFSILSFQSTSFAEESRLDSVIERHFETIENLNLEEPFILNSLLIKFVARGRLTPEMVDYFATNINSSFTFYRAHKLAELVSKTVCGLPEGSARRVDDEVDAVRHFVWASYLTYHLGETEARKIMSMQENRSSDLSLGNQMDLYNNERGIEFASEVREMRPVFEGRILKQFTRRRLKMAINEHLDRQMFMVIESKPSACRK